jgi:hypothetical protein
VDEVIPMFLRHEKILMLSVFLQLIVEIYFIVVGYMFREETYEEVGFA